MPYWELMKSVYIMGDGQYPYTLLLKFPECITGYSKPQLFVFVGVFSFA
jgi:hypothetical protein